jgi:hypothetical protein
LRSHNPNKAVIAQSKILKGRRVGHFVAVLVVAQAQGVPGGINNGAHRGAYTGHSVLGPVGGIVGGVVGGAAGDVVGGVNGVFGIYPHGYHRRHYRR